MSDQILGQQGLSDNANLYQVIKFLIRQELGMSRTTTLVKIMKVHGGGVGPPPTVDVLPLVNQIDGGGNKTEHNTVYGIPVSRNHGGVNAIINDPQVGDIGTLTIGDRDHSSVIANADQANPGSYRRHSLSDGTYTGCLALKVTPTQYLLFQASGLKLVDKNGNVIGFQGSDPHIYINPNGASGKLYLGGDGTQGAYALVQTVSGPSINVYARIP